MCVGDKKTQPFDSLLEQYYKYNYLKNQLLSWKQPSLLDFTIESSKLYQVNKDFLNFDLLNENY